MPCHPSDHRQMASVVTDNRQQTDVLSDKKNSGMRPNKTSKGLWSPLMHALKASLDFFRPGLWEQMEHGAESLCNARARREMCSGIAVVRIKDSQVRGFEAPGAAVAFRYESPGSDSGSDKGVQVNVDNQAVKASSQDSQAQINNAWLCAMRHRREAGERYVRDVMPPYGVWAHQSDPGNIPSRRPRSAVLGELCSCPLTDAMGDVNREWPRCRRSGGSKSPRNIPKRG
ncbi:hypothetical protein B0T13DRAFT_497577 [Neurospora crassa]|nr:hypothetical protein B0T13DRAFT_497577 [Neurospora crassa]